MQPASQNPYPIYEQILWFSLPYLWPDQKFDMVLFTAIAAGTVALNIIYEGLLLMVLSIIFSKKHTQSNTRVEKPYLIYDQNGQN